MGAKTRKLKCPICFHTLKFLWDRTSKLETSKNGNEYWKHQYEEKAFYCKYCDVIFPLDLQQNVNDLKELI